MTTKKAAYFFLFSALLLFSTDVTCRGNIPKKDTNTVRKLIGLSWDKKSAGNLDSAMIYIDQALELSIALDYKKGIVRSHSIIGIINKYRGNYPEALKHMLTALKLLDTICLQSKTSNYCRNSLADIYNNLGNIHKEQGNYPEALKNHFASLELKKETGNKSGISASYNNIGNIYLHLKDYSKALGNYQLSLEIDLQLDNKQDVSIDYNNIGVVYSCLGNYQEALKNHYLSLKIKEEINDKEGIASSYINLGDIHICLKKNVLAKEYLIKGLRLSEEVGSKDDIKDAYKALAKVDSATGNYKEAFENYKIYILHQDSLINEENTKKIIQANMLYDFEKKVQATKAEQDKKDALAEEEKQKQILVIYSISIGLFLVILFALFVYRSYRQKQKANVEVTSQKVIIEEKQKEIIDSITYAKRIQQSLLPTERYIEKTLIRLKK